MTIQQLVENKTTLDYQKLCTELIQIFTVNETVNWESVLPAQQQQEYFGGETLRLIADHPILSKQKDIRPIALKKGSISQMLFFYVCLNDNSLTKKSIQDVTKKFISGGDANRYIIWFFGNTKNTELKVVLSAKEGKKVVLKTLPFATNQPYFKTYNYILNEVSQNVNKLFVEPTELWKALWKAFDISIVNRNFYNEIKEVFDSLILYELKTSSRLFKKDEIKVQFAIRLIGRIIFCWFLKRKGIINEEVLSSLAVKKHESYYHNLLSVLFFDVFNTPEKERKAGIPKIIANYPFLNGGLFEAQETDFKDNLILKIDNDWFYNFFSKTLERYNFTVDENSSNNAEIAIDPEMLGRIFENLLAEQNPETGDSARKATGSFYTPREIVDYMVEQSIGEYLKTSLSEESVEDLELKEDLFGLIPHQQLELPKVRSGNLPDSWESLIDDFVHTHTLPASLEKYENQISEALLNIKVLDPACGSGAFPIGVLQKIIALKQQLHPKEKNYKLKLDTIQNSIYGIDIQPMAVELSRLRCWLSLVVDEEPNDIKALPNLDFKFVCADTLIDVPESEYVKLKSAESLNKLSIATSQYFIPDHKKKKELREVISKCLYDISKTHDVLIRSIIEQTRKEKNSATSKRLKLLEHELVNYSYQQRVWHTYTNIFENKKVDFFSTQYFFPTVTTGFDVVIANPPYIQLSKEEKVEESYKELLKDTYKTSGGRLNTFIFFIHRGLSLLKSNGVLTYIIPNTILTQDYYKYTREQILVQNNLKTIVNYVDMPFENAVVENVTLIVKKQASEGYPINIYSDNLENIELISTKLKSDFLKNNFAFNINTNDIIESVFSRELKTLEYYCEVNQAIALKGDKSLSLKTENKKGKYYRLLDGRNINRYEINWDGIYLDHDLERIHSCKRKDIFESKEKLMFRRVSENLIFTYDTEQYYALNTIIVVNKKPKASINLKYLLAILNSKLLNYLYKGKFKSTKKVFSEIQTRSVEQLPIVESANESVFVQIVDFILYLKKIDTKIIHESISNSLVTKYFEDVLDGMVLELYFEAELKTNNLEIIELVKSKLDQLKSKNIEENILTFYLALSHPDSPIRNRILNFPIASPTILKTILQG